MSLCYFYERFVEGSPVNVHISILNPNTSRARGLNLAQKKVRVLVERIKWRQVIVTI